MTEELAPNPPPKSQHVAADSPTVAAHITILQSVIQRMNGNSSSCKAWCITIVSAILILVGDKGKPEFAWIAAIPAVLFLVLDAYYLALEREFRAAYNQFIAKLHADTLRPDDVFVVEPKGRIACDTIASMGSFSVWPFYGTLLAMTATAVFILHSAVNVASPAAISAGSTTTTITTTSTVTVPNPTAVPPVVPSIPSTAAPPVQNPTPATPVVPPTPSATAPASLPQALPPVQTPAQRH